MNNNFHTKSTNEQIKQKFDSLVDKFSNINTGQTSAMDSAIIMEIIANTAFAVNPNAKKVLDIGCGAGNYCIMLLSKIQNLDCTLIDLSPKMLEKAKERINSISKGKVILINKDIRKVELPDQEFDIIMAGTSLHHLREEEEWQQVFEKIYRSVKNGGSFWISDIILHDHPQIQKYMYKRYEEYLVNFGGEELKNWVNEQIEIEDTPRSLNFQLDLLKRVGFKQVEILHKNSVYAAFGGIK
ncbi:MAG: class I SAM-dependent methyltransferase [Bacteroidales bacterium]|nr:class I SAM-dependent methyltransferase [Bacteroidales bacterium]